MPAAGPFVTAATMSLDYKADRLAGELHLTESLGVPGIKNIQKKKLVSA